MSMLCVDEFYERNLQGKTKKEILKVIDKLNKEFKYPITINQTNEKEN